MSQLFDDEVLKELKEHQRNEAHRDGYNAYCDGLKQNDNPYDRDEEENLYEAWKSGYDDAAWDD